MEQKIAAKRRLVEEIEGWFSCDPESPDLGVQLRARMAETSLRFAMIDLAEAEAALEAFKAPTSLRHKGIVYQVAPSLSGAH